MAETNFVGLPRIRFGIAFYASATTERTLFFDSYPIFFNAELLRNATQVALRRTDIDVKFVQAFPPDARYTIHYENEVDAGGLTWK